MIKIETNWRDGTEKVSFKYYKSKFAAFETSQHHFRRKAFRVHFVVSCRYTYNSGVTDLSCLLASYFAYQHYTDKHSLTL